MTKYRVENEMPLEEALLRLSPGSSKTTVRKWLAEGRVFLNGKPLKNFKGQADAGSLLELGNRVQFLEGGVKILYEDQDLVAVEKPCGLLSVSTAFEKGETLHAILKRHYRPKKVQVVHRLDQETSGVMLFCLSERAFEPLKELFAAHAIDREYEALVEGKLTEKEGTWSCYLYEDERYQVHKTEDPKRGQWAVTHFEVIKASSRVSHLKLKLETGRKNQIRVHCQLAGHPVVGDKKYGATMNFLRRLALHARLLAFSHPITKKRMEFVSPPPERFSLG